MIVYIAADHRGFYLKDKIKEWLLQLGFEYQDLGNQKYDKEDDYTDFAIKLAEKVAFEKSKGILICGGGVGVCITANKASGARAALCTMEKQARLSREDDDANILCLSADLVNEDENKTIVETFLKTPFSPEERHIRRINKIKKYESENH